MPISEMSYSINGVGRGARFCNGRPLATGPAPLHGAGVIDCPHCTTGLDLGLK